MAIPFDVATFYYPVKSFGLATPSTLKGKLRAIASPSRVKGWMPKADGVVRFSTLMEYIYT